jgi:subtilase family serine protease
MKFQSSFEKLAAAASLALAAVSGHVLHAQSLIEVPHSVERSVDRGAVPADQEANITVHLKLHNEAAFHQAVQDLYDPSSPSYHHWMTAADFAKYAPTAAEVKSVENELRSHGLSILAADPNKFTVRAHGTALNLEHAFQTQLHLVEYKGETMRANISPARLTGAAGDLVDSVTGLAGYSLKPQFRLPTNPKTGKVLARFPLDIKKGKALINLADYYTDNCFGAPETETLTSDGDPLPVAVYSGNSYLPVAGLACAWRPSQIQGYYQLTPAYQKGINGAGQSIVIIDGPTNSDYLSDFTAYSTVTGLPAVTSANYTQIYPDGAPSQTEYELGDATGETQLDIEMAHTIAPQAKIQLLITPTFDWDEFEYAIQYAVAHKLGNVISLSYGYPEVLFGAYTVKGFEQTLEVAAAAGVAVNISSGDSGDEGLGSPTAGGDSYPAASAFATSIGGTTIGFPGTNVRSVEIGWGNNLTFLSDYQDLLIDPPQVGGFNGGSGGGESGFIAKPSWQSKLPGTGRQQPDISAVADPFTGVVVFADGYVEAVGGTSAAAPIVSGMWALADQMAGKSLGQAAPLLPKLLSAILDVVPQQSPNNVTGVITNYNGTQNKYSAVDLSTPATSSPFVSVLFDSSFSGGGAFDNLSFGTDSSLTVGYGWDNVTGYGVPKGSTFVQAAAALK